MIVLDARVLIAHFDAGDALHYDAGDLLRSVADQPLRMSPITEAEVLVGPARAGRLDRAIAALAQLGVKTVPLGDNGPVRLAMLRAEIRLKLPDCCVLYTAVRHDAVIATFDDTLAKRANEIGLTVAAAGG